MIKVDVKNDKISITGHALYDDFGKDIVCASVSSIVITTINSIIRFDDKSIKYDLNNGIVITIIKETEETKILIENMLCLLEELEKNYKKNIKINREV
jgi:hypothetical protein